MFVCLVRARTRDGLLKAIRPLERQTFVPKLAVNYSFA
jgi:hypothetical protein